MALHGMIQVNSISIGWWSAVRVTTGPQPAPDDMVAYNCQVRQSKTLEGNSGVNWQGQVQHRFGDGALALASEVLAAANAASHLQTRLPADKEL